MKHSTHEFEGGTGKAEARTRVVMVAEITAGTVFGSSALRQEKLVSWVALPAPSFFWLVVAAAMGFVGSLMIILWAIGILKETVVLFDYFPKESELEDEIRRAFHTLPHSEIHDLHLWQIASGKFATIISVEAAVPQPLETYQALVNLHEELVHVTLQVGSPS
jgi:Co/Zn/Cd efflux system component